MLHQAFALLALALSAHAAQLFSNTGTTSGWDAQNHEHFGTVQQVTNVVYEGPTALKMTQIYDSSYTGRYHSEVIKLNAAARGQERFYGFAFRLQDDWQFSPAQSYNIGQFIADFSDYGCDDFIPSTMIWLVGNQLYSRVRTGPPCSSTITTFPNLATVTAGAWHRIEVQMNWQSDTTGYYKLWLDGVKVLEKFNIATLMNDGRAYQFSVGLYANGWHDDGGMKGTQGTRQIWYDEIAYGTTFADADPNQW
ncbi:polysaccharide lyase [Crepidotus variabilis]|uniref:Polysaccharide lyase n=1 Tax=Crepidotus variabilis TaxID=179855 RepID=A0A9P6EKN4_9AGAR|nr:polysaccharide lyase [Crepidotus variabilis]